MGLRSYLSRIIVPPSLADVICKRNVDGVFLKSVQELESKFQYLTNHEKNQVNHNSNNNNEDDRGAGGGGGGGGGIVPDPVKTPSGVEMRNERTHYKTPLSCHNAI